MPKQLFWIIFLLLCVYVLPHVIDNVIMANSGVDISETPLVNVPEE